jgi:hypothetical protein
MSSPSKDEAPSFPHGPPDSRAPSSNLFENKSSSEYNDSSVARNSSIPIPDRGHGNIAVNSKTGKIMDPFEVRIRFTQHLQHLNASVTSANKAAQYALKFRDMDEDLHSCILEQLERVCFVFFDMRLHFTWSP